MGQFYCNWASFAYFQIKCLIFSKIDVSAKLLGVIVFCFENLRGQNLYYLGHMEPLVLAALICVALLHNFPKMDNKLVQIQSGASLFYKFSCVKS